MHLAQCSCQIKHRPAMHACPACITGSLDEGETKGVEEALLPNISCYISRPDPTNANGSAIILGTDVFGYKLINARLIADAFAQQGYLVVVPDYFDNDPVPSSMLELFEGLQYRPLLARMAGYLQLLGALYGMFWWIKRHPEPHAVDVVAQVSQVLREKHAIQKVGFQGYCYGGSVGVLLGDKPSVVDAISIAHPGPVKIDDVKKIVVPCLLLCAESDFWFPAGKRTRVLQTLQEQHPGLAQFILYPGTTHGFATRGDKRIPAVNAAREDALRQGIAFFNQHLCGAAPVPPDQVVPDGATKPVGVWLNPKTSEVVAST